MAANALQSGVHTPRRAPSWWSRPALLVLLLHLMLGVPAQASAGSRLDGDLERVTAAQPRPGTTWWWSVRADALARAAERSSAVLDLAIARHIEAVTRQSAMHERARQASNRHLGAARSLVRLDERLRELSARRVAVEQRVNVGLAMLGQRARDGGAGPAAARMRLLAADLMAEGARQRRRCDELSGYRGLRALELRLLAAEARSREGEARAGDAEVTAGLMHRHAATLEWMEIDRRLAAVARQHGRMVQLLARLPAVGPLAANARAALRRVDREGYRRGIDLDRRLDRRLLRLAGTAMRPSGIARWRRMAPVPGAGPPVASDGRPRSSQAFGPFSPLLLPIAGAVRGPGPTGSGLSESGLTLTSTVSQTVSAPLDGRVVFAAPFRGFGPLLIIDRGGGYHVLMAGLSQLDVREGASVVAGQAVGEIVARGDEPARLYLELRYRGVPLDPAPRLAAREDKVRS